MDEAERFVKDALSFYGLQPQPRRDKMASLRCWLRRLWQRFRADGDDFYAYALVPTKPRLPARSFLLRKPLP